MHRRIRSAPSSEPSDTAPLALLAAPLPSRSPPTHRSLLHEPPRFPRDPADAAWATLAPTRVPLVPQDMVEPRLLIATTGRAGARGHRRQPHRLPLEWSDPTADDLPAGALLRRVRRAAAGHGVARRAGAADGRGGGASRSPTGAPSGRRLSMAGKTRSRRCIRTPASITTRSKRHRCRPIRGAGRDGEALRAGARLRQRHGRTAPAAGPGPDRRGAGTLRPRQSRSRAAAARAPRAAGTVLLVRPCLPSWRRANDRRWRSRCGTGRAARSGRARCAPRGCPSLWEVVNETAEADRIGCGASGRGGAVAAAGAAVVAAES